MKFSAIIEMYGPQLIKMVEANLQPDAICGALGLCDGQKKTIPQRCQETKQVGLCRALIECKFSVSQKSDTTLPVIFSLLFQC